MSSLSRSLHALSVAPSGQSHAGGEVLEGEHTGLEVTTVGSLADATHVLTDRAVDCLLVTDPLEWSDGAAFEALRERRPGLPVVAVLTTDRPDSARAVVAAGADEYVRASVLADTPELLGRRVESAVRSGGRADPEHTGRGDGTLATVADATGDGSGAGGPIAETIVDNFPNGAVTLVGPDLHYHLAGGQLFEKLAIDPEDITGVHVGDIDPGDRETFVRSYREALDGDETVTETVVEGATLVHRTVPVRDQDGSVTAAVGMTQDVTERKRREQELLRKSRAIEAAPVGISITDPEQEGNPIIYANQAFLDTSGYEREDVLGRNCRFMQGEETDPETVETIRAAIDEKRHVSTEIRNYRADGTAFWNALEIAPVWDEDGDLLSYVGFQQDVTERKQRERALRRRERILRELHVASREFYPATSAEDVAAFVVDFLEDSFEFGYVSVKRFDEREGVLRPAAKSVGADDEIEGPGVVEPGDGPLWEAYRTGESRLIDDLDADRPIAAGREQLLAVPLGDFGLVVVRTAGERTFDDVDRDLIEVLATNAETVLQSLKRKEERVELAGKLASQEQTLAELRSVVDTIQAIQQRIADSENRDALETSVCAELLETDHIDFAWVGHPQSGDTDLTPSTWAGAASGYHDSVLSEGDTTTLPAQQAAKNREPYAVPNVAERVHDEQWAKEALSAQFRSALSVPLVYDDVLYGVLTVYSRTKAAFDSVYADLVGDAASLLVTYSRILEQRHTGTTQEVTELEFLLTDATYPLQRLADETGSRLRYDTVAETSDDATRVLVTVTEGDAGDVLALARSIPSVLAARRFGDDTSEQLSLTVENPFLASDVGKHGGEVVEALSERTGTRIRIELPRTVSTRPLLDALTSRFQEIDLVAQRQHVHSDAGRADDLTERQYEILNAAYHGGYYDTPRRVTGEGLAAAFDISGPAVSKHLQAAHRKVCEQFLRSSREQS